MGLGSDASLPREVHNERPIRDRRKNFGTGACYVSRSPHGLREIRQFRCALRAVGPAAGREAFGTTGAPMIEFEPENRRRRPDLNRGWRFCGFRQVLFLDGWSCFLVVGAGRFYVVFGRYCSRIVLDSVTSALAESPDAEEPPHRQSVATPTVYRDLTCGFSRVGSAPKARRRPSQSFTTNSRECQAVSPRPRVNSTPRAT